MPDPPAPPGVGPRPWPLGLAVGLVALALFGFDLGREPVFVDESAYLAQTYFLDLLLEGRRDDWAWLEYHAYDLPPLPKYLIGLGLKLEGRPLGNRAAAGAWFRNTGRPVAEPAAYLAGRRPVALLGAIGCVAIYSLGTLARDRRTGLLAAGLLMLDPLYRIHARRAMSDAPAEALILAALAVGLGAWSRTLSGRIGLAGWLASAIGVGVLAGLAVLSKLNGGLALMVVAAWGTLAMVPGPLSIGRRLAVLASVPIAALMAMATFMTLNPFVNALPMGPPPPGMLGPAPADASWRERLRLVVDHRAGVSRDAGGQFPGDALRTPREKAAAVVVQGFGRFGPLGPQDHDSLTAYPRYAWSRDGAALAWLPCVVAGAAWAGARGRRQLREGRPPIGWALLAYAAVALGTVGAFIPLAWDRYFLSIQAPSILLASGAAVAGLDRLAGRLRPRAEVTPS